MVNYVPIIDFFLEKGQPHLQTHLLPKWLCLPLWQCWQREDKNSPERGVSGALFAHCHQDSLDLLTILLSDYVGRQFSVDLGVFIAKGSGVKKTHMK